MRLFQVDAFAADAFAGNPAAVCLLARPQRAHGLPGFGPRGMVQVRAEGERVLLAGRAVTVFAGHLSDAALPA